MANLTGKDFMDLAIAESKKGMDASEGGPFGAAIVKGGKVVAKAHNQVTSQNDPTAHAEIQAIRQAGKLLDTFDLSGCELYTSCEPCPMCLGAIFWARIDKVYYANTEQDAAAIGFDDAKIYEELRKQPVNRSLPFINTGREEAIKVFQAWDALENKTPY